MPIDASEQIEQFQEFFETHSKEELQKLIGKGLKSIGIDFFELTKFDPKLADQLLEEPEETIKAAEIAIEQLDTKEPLRVRFKNFPASQNFLIRNIRSIHLDKFIELDGIIRQASDVRPEVVSAKFECPSCGNTITMLQTENKFREPNRCTCGRKGRFRLLSKELVDAQRLVLEEPPQMLEGGAQPKRISVFLREDLVDPKMERNTTPGTNVKVTGIVKEVAIPHRDGGISTRFEIIMNGNHIETLQEDFTDLEVSKEDEEEIKALAKDKKIYDKLVNSIAPSIYGHDRIKEAVMLQMFGGIRKQKKDGTATRGDLHILLIGDPGAGKCVKGDTKIILESGEIKTIREFNRERGKVFSLDLKGKNTSKLPKKFWKRKAPSNMFKVITESGNEIIVTKEHPLFTTQNGLIFSKETQNFKKGEYLATPSKIKVKGKIQKVSQDIVKSPAKNKKKYLCKELLDSDFSRLLGYLTGDGYVNFSKTSGKISFTNNDPDLLNDFEKLIKKVFNLNVFKRLKKGSQNTWEYYISSIEIVRILEKIEPNIIKRSGDMKISKYLMKSPNNILKEFIKSLFDCEAHIRQDRREIEFSSKSYDLAYELKLVLLRWGIVSQLSSSMKCATNTEKKIKRKYYRLRISGEDVIKFEKEISFISNIKKQKLKKITKFKTKLNTNINIIPNLSKLLLALRQKYGLSQFAFPVVRSTYQHYERGDRNPSYEKLKILSKFYTKLNKIDPLIKILNELSNAEIFWDKIKKLEQIKIKETYVYDLEIPQVHNYLANGLIIHNSSILTFVNAAAPKSRYIAGRSTSGAGITATVVKDDFLRGWALEAGAIVLADKGILLLDEMDKMSDEDTSALHEAMEQQTVTITKANIQACLRSQTSILAGANPKFGRFDPYTPIPNQIQLPPALINRFDLIFTVRDLPNKDLDAKIAEKILESQSSEEKDPPIPAATLRKYIAYTRQQISPKLTRAATEIIQEFYVTLRNTGTTGGDEGIKPIPISPRQIEAIIRLSEASARIRLSNKVTKEDAKKAIGLLKYCLHQVGVDPETGEMDIDQISTGISASSRGKIVGIRDIIYKLDEGGKKTMEIAEIIKLATEKGIPVQKVEEVIEKLKRSGDIFEPKKGWIQKI